MEIYNNIPLKFASPDYQDIFAERYCILIYDGKFSESEAEEYAEKLTTEYFKENDEN